MKESTSRPCWICGDPANSDEHKHKRSDLVARYGRNWTPEQQPFVIRGDGSARWTRIQGPNDRKNLYEKYLCRPCNNARTKPFDQAYQEFSDWILATGTTLHSKEAIDFAEIYGSAYTEKSLNLLSYFAKSLGCRIVDAGTDPPEALRRILTDVNRNVRRCRLFGQPPGKNKLRAGSRLLVSRFPEIKFIACCCGVL